MSNEDKSWYGKKYDEYYKAYVPWIEDKVLAWFGENKTSYTAKGTLLSRSTAKTNSQPIISPLYIISISLSLSHSTSLISLQPLP